MYDLRKTGDIAQIHFLEQYTPRLFSINYIYYVVSLTIWDERYLYIYIVPWYRISWYIYTAIGVHGIYRI